MKRSKLFSVILIAIMCVFLLTSCTPSEPPQGDNADPSGTGGNGGKETKIISSSWLVPPPALSSLDQRWLIDEIKECTNGRVTVEEFWSGALVPAMEHLDAVSSGMADLARLTFLYWPTDFPLNTMAYMFPFANTDPAMAVRVMREMYKEFPQFEEEMTKNNIKLIVLQVWDDYALLTRDKITGIKDLKGKKVALLGGMLTEWAKTADIVPTSIPMDERYIQLKNGVIDGSLISVDSMVSFNQHEVAKYLTFFDLGAYVPNCLAMNLDTWNALSAEDQENILKAGEEIEIRYAEKMLEDRAGYIETMKEAGVEICDFPDADRVKMAEKLPDLAAQWAKDVEKLGYPGWEMVKRYKELYEEQGHEWISTLKIGEQE